MLPQSMEMNPCAWFTFGKTFRALKIFKDRQNEDLKAKVSGGSALFLDCLNSAELRINT